LELSLHTLTIFFCLVVQLQSDILACHRSNHLGIAKSLPVHVFTERAPVGEHVRNDQFFFDSSSRNRLVVLSFPLDGGGPSNHTGAGGAKHDSRYEKRCRHQGLETRKSSA